jgi:hypothetical protein
MRHTRFLVATAAAAALLVGAATAGAASSGRPSGAVLASNGDDPDGDDRDGRTFLFGALLTGSAEVPGPGDDDGSAAALVRIRPSTGRVCVLGFAHHQIAEPTLFHIHAGTADVAGPVVVDFVPLLPSGIGCVNVDRQVTRAIVADPAAYYFNVHNDDFPAGAVRGTLAAF